MSFSLFKKKILSSVLTATLAGGAFLSGNVQAVHLSEKGTGQVLLAPMYRTDNGYMSEFTIVNPLPDRAVKVRVAIRSHLDSVEDIDFVCYMTPTDVCRFTLHSEENTDTATKGQDGGRNLILQSSDDSLKTPLVENSAGSELVDFNKLSPRNVTNEMTTVNYGGVTYNLVDSLSNTPSVFASQIPFRVNISEFTRKNAIALGTPNNHPLARGDSMIRGHVEIIGVYAVGNVTDTVTGNVSIPQGFTKNGTQRGINIFQGMSKYDLAQIFDAPRRSVDYDARIHMPIALQRPLVVGENLGAISGVTRESNDRTDDSNRPYSPFNTTGAAGTLTTIRSTDDSWTLLSGSVMIASATDRYQYNMPAFDGSLGDNVPTVTATDGFSTRRFVQPNRSVASQAADGLNAVNTTQAIFDGLVISNPVFDLNNVALFPMGNNMGIRMNTFSGSSSAPTAIQLLDSAQKVVELERAMAFESSRGIYKTGGVNGENTAVMVTFPFRYQHLTNNPCNAVVSGAYTPPFRPNGSVQVGFTAYDDFENDNARRATGSIVSPVVLPQPVIGLVEGNYFQLGTNIGGVNNSWPFTQGWYRMDVTMDNQVNGCPYPGVPGIVFSHIYKGSKLGGIMKVATGGAITWDWTDGTDTTQSVVSKNNNGPLVSCSNVGSSCDTRF